MKVREKETTKEFGPGGEQNVHTKVVCLVNNRRWLGAVVPAPADVPALLLLSDDPFRWITGCSPLRCWNSRNSAGSWSRENWALSMGRRRWARPANPNILLELALVWKSPLGRTGNWMLPLFLWLLVILLLILLALLLLLFSPLPVGETDWAISGRDSEEAALCMRAPALSSYIDFGSSTSRLLLLPEVGVGLRA